MMKLIEEPFNPEEKCKTLEDQSNFYTVLLFVLIRIWARYFVEYVVLGVLLVLLSVLSFLYVVRLIIKFIKNKREIENYKRRLIFLYLRLLFNGILVGMSLYYSISSIQD